MTTQFKIKPGQVFYIKTLLSEGNKYYPLEITKVTVKCVFFTLDGINRRGELKTDKYGNQYFTKYCPECLVGVYHHTPMVNPDEPTEVETMENPNIDAEYTLGQAVIRCHGKDEKTLLGTVTEIDGGMFIVTCLDGIKYWEDDLNLVPDTEFNRATYGLSAPQTSVKSEPVSNVIDMFTRKPLQV